MNKDQAIQCINDLINDYKQAHIKSKYDDLSDLHNDALTKSIKVRALNIIEATTGEGSVYRKQAYHNDRFCVSIPQLIGILEPLKSDIENGILKLDSKTNRKQNIVETNKDNTTITKGYIENLTIIDLVKRLSLGAWLWVVAIVGSISFASFKLGLHFEQIKNLF